MEINVKQFNELITNEKLVALVIKERQLEMELRKIQKEIAHFQLKNHI